MRLNPSFSAAPAVITTPAEAIQRLRAFFIANGLETLSEDEDLRFSFQTTHDGVSIQVVVACEVEMNRIVFATSLLEESERPQAELIAFANHLNCRLAYTMLVVLDQDPCRVGFENYLILAEGTCLAAQLDYIASAHMGSLARVMKPVARFISREMETPEVLEAIT
ncbi:MAG: hypothetical protein F9K30_24380 [Dechloromonas sp.]|nr:MAG: hypothetical protein F9K30_24380 [Dechloromonas sp.]